MVNCEIFDERCCKTVMEFKNRLGVFCVCVFLCGVTNVPYSVYT